VLLKPILIVLSLPAILLTLGLFTFLVNGFLVWLAANLIPGFSISFWAAVLAGMIVSLVNYVLTGLLELRKN
jgi:putative membrane protein